MHCCTVMGPSCLQLSGIGANHECAPVVAQAALPTTLALVVAHALQTCSHGFRMGSGFRSWGSDAPPHAAMGSSQGRAHLVLAACWAARVVIVIHVVPAGQDTTHAMRGKRQATELHKEQTGQ